MEFSKINALTKHGPDDYDLWTLTLPREKLQGIRQQLPVFDGDMRRVFEKIPSADHQSDGTIHFLLPHSEGLTLFSKDMGENFRDDNRYNGSSVRGTREEIMAELRDNLKTQGYAFRPNAAFFNVDVLTTLQKIMEHNTSYYQTDFAYDKEKLQKAAENIGGNRHFLWMTRDAGTWCFSDRDVHIRNTSPHNTWLYYGGCRSEHVKAFGIELHSVRDDVIKGNIFELDYQKHLDYLCTHSFDPVKVEISFSNPLACRLFDYQEYDQNWQSIVQRYGTADRRVFLVEDEQALARAVLQGRSMFWEATQEMSVDDYVKRMDHDRLHDYGYTADDLMLTGPLDAQVAVQHGLSCFALQKDGSKERIFDREAYQKQHYKGVLFGMSAEEKATLQYFRQECIPLFSPAEMRQICTLAVQAGMENDPVKAPLLDSIIHKAECAMLNEETEHALEQEQDMDMEARA